MEQMRKNRVNFSISIRNLSYQMHKVPTFVRSRKRWLVGNFTPISERFDFMLTESVNVICAF